MSDSMKIGLAAAALLVAAVFYFRVRSAPSQAPLAPVTEADARAGAEPGQIVSPSGAHPDSTSAPMAAPKGTGTGPNPTAAMPQSGKKIRGAEILTPGAKPTSPHTWSGMEPDPSAGVDPSQGPDPKAGPQKTQ